MEFQMKETSLVSFAECAVVHTTGNGRQDLS